MTSQEFSKLHKGNPVIYFGDRLPDYQGCEAVITSIDHQSGMATIKLPDDHVAIVTREQIEVTA